MRTPPRRRHRSRRHGSARPGDVSDYRALERSLGISPRPIAIDEYAAPADVDVPSAALHYIDNFERSGVTNASRAYWYESGTVNGLLYNNQPTSTYWMYKWYGDMTGNMVAVTASDYEDGIASYDSSTKTVNVVFGGEVGNNAVRIDGLGALGSQAKVVVSYTPSLGRKTNLAAPTTLSSTTYNVTNGSITVPFNNQDNRGAYQIRVTPAGASSGGYLRFENHATGLFIDGMGRTTNGSNAGQYSSSTSSNQQWQIVPDGSYVRLQNKATGLFLDGEGRTTNGSAVGQWSNSTSNNQQWLETTVGSYVKFQNRATGLYMDGEGRTANGSDLGQWSNSSSNNQQWQIVSG